MTKRIRLSGLQLGLGCLERRRQEVAEIACRFVEVKAHSLAAKTLGHDIELDTSALLVIDSMMS